MDLNQFINKYNGKSVGSGQCVALVRQYNVEVLGNPNISGGNAKDWYDNFENTSLPSYFNKVSFTGSNTPSRGDIIVWNGNVGGGYGHIAIVTGIISNGFQSFDQNWNTPKKCKIENHTWKNISGWLVSKGSTPVPPTPPTGELKLRKGIYGNYYGTEFNASVPINNEEFLKVNAKYILDYLSIQGWSTQAISGMLGNMMIESTLNPGRWQNEEVGNLNSGYGLVQWTPASKYIDWVNTDTGKWHYSNDPSEIDNQIGRIQFELNNNLQWIPTEKYPSDWVHFATDIYSSPETLASAFLYNYERPKSYITEEDRRTWARYFYDYLTNIQPDIKKKNKWNRFSGRRYTLNG